VLPRCGHCPGADERIVEDEKCLGADEGLVEEEQVLRKDGLGCADAWVQVAKQAPNQHVELVELKRSRAEVRQRVPPEYHGKTEPGPDLASGQRHVETFRDDPNEELGRLRAEVLQHPLGNSDDAYDSVPIVMIASSADVCRMLAGGHRHRLHDFAREVADKASRDKSCCTTDSRHSDVSAPSLHATASRNGCRADNGMCERSHDAFLIPRLAEIKHSHAEDTYTGTSATPDRPLPPLPRDPVESRILPRTFEIPCPGVACSCVLGPAKRAIADVDTQKTQDGNYQPCLR